MALFGLSVKGGENTFFIHEGPRKGTKKTFARALFGLSAKGGGEHLLIHEGPRRAAENTFARALFGLSTKDREENLLWSTQIMVVEHENQARNGLILPAGGKLGDRG